MKPGDHVMWSIQGKITAGVITRVIGNSAIVEFLEGAYKSRLVVPVSKLKRADKACP